MLIVVLLEIVWAQKLFPVQSRHEISLHRESLREDLIRWNVQEVINVIRSWG